MHTWSHPFTISHSFGSIVFCVHFSFSFFILSGSYSVHINVHFNLYVKQKIKRICGLSLKHSYGGATMLRFWVAKRRLVELKVAFISFCSIRHVYILRTENLITYVFHMKTHKLYIQHRQLFVLWMGSYVFCNCCYEVFFFVEAEYLS